MKGVTWDEAWSMSGEYRKKIIGYVNKVYEEQEAAMTGKRKM